MDLSIRKITRMGNGGHVYLNKEDINKDVLVGILDKSLTVNAIDRDPDKLKEALKHLSKLVK